ncbi:MAG: GTPase Era [Chloroflexi bacterium RBG_19FT_COMBO_47_9]|nr:MAG: GTPase Era [Chloroflexi bacterium RBG_19FT_COMBO_47_9]
MDNRTGEYRVGFVAVMGRPNVGKSTLINAIVGQKVAAVSPRPQTTRRRQEGILTTDDYQIILIDTPGVHQSRSKLGESMNIEARSALEHCDLVLFMVDASQMPSEEDKILAGLLHTTVNSDRLILVLNKIDMVQASQIPEIQSAYQKLLQTGHNVLTSATRGDNREILIEKIVTHLPPGEPFYPEEQVTDLFERDITADLIREACLNYLRYEVPHGIVVRIDEFTERSDLGVYIEATIFVERESHKGIVIGQNGQMLKKIGTASRKEIEAMSSKKVYLQLRVKVRKNWRDDEKLVKQMFST